MTDATLHLTFSGRIIDHLGIQMYQSPTAAIAEMIANSWDADASHVEIQIPESNVTSGTIVLKDNGHGMTLKECQDRFLNVGYCRRGSAATENTRTGRPVLGRKGIGKFAGFGIANKITISTTAESTGEHTEFTLDLGKLRSDTYLGSGADLVAKTTGPVEANKKDHGTTITLSVLKLKKSMNANQFRRSMARKFLLQSEASAFKIRVNAVPLPDEATAEVEYEFPRDFEEDEKPNLMTVLESGWGEEPLSSGDKVQWRIRFYKEPINDEELCGVSVFAGIKLAQRPFVFNLGGGLGGQHAQEYVSGIVRADFLDRFAEDVIATERQRVNWEDERVLPLQQWGQDRLKLLYRLWKSRRSEEKNKLLEGKLATFAQRLAKLPSHERRTVKSALVKLGGIETLSSDQFGDLAQAVLKSWEQGRLHALIDEISQTDDLSADGLIKLLAEADVLTALNLAEVVKTKLESVRALKQLVEKRLLENKLRDYIADRPYLLDPKWETFRKEIKVESILKTAAEEAGLADTDYTGRLDLALVGHRELLVVEFMRPGLTLDFDHASRCQDYVNILQAKIFANSALGIERVTGLLVADKLSNKTGMQQRIDDMKRNGIYAYDWDMLLKSAEANLREFLEVVAERAPEDDRLKQLKHDARQPQPTSAT